MRWIEIALFLAMVLWAVRLLFAALRTGRAPINFMIVRWSADPTLFLIALAAYILLLGIGVRGMVDVLRNW
ncbi:MAG TPA: hypothetical protein VF669_21585 [Tepidisphaeraceae bacterium]|jgi:hypothetical protein